MLIFLLVGTLSATITTVASFAVQPNRRVWNAASSYISYTRHSTTRQSIYVPYVLKRISLNRAPCENVGSDITQITLRAQQQNDNDESTSGRKNDETVQIGTEEYYKGFVSRSLDEEPIERVTGDAVLGPTFQFVGGFTLIIGVLLLGFMASNGLI